MPLISNQVQIGTSGTPENNFVLQSNGDGSAKLSRGILGATTQDIITWDAAGKVSLPQGETPVVSKLVSGTAQATTSGTSIDFTGIPSWVKRITVMLNGVSTNGTSNPLIQLGAGTIDTSGYTGTEGYFQASNSCTATVFPSNGFLLHQDITAGTVRYGVLYLVNMGGNIWCISGLTSNGAVQITNIVGLKSSLSGALDRLRLTTVNGTDTFDAGSVNIMYE